METKEYCQLIDRILACPALPAGKLVLLAVANTLVAGHHHPESFLAITGSELKEVANVPERTFYRIVAELIRQDLIQMHSRGLWALGVRLLEEV